MRFYSKTNFILLAGALGGSLLHADIPLDLGEAKNWSTYRSATVKNSNDTSGALVFHLPTFATRTWRIPHLKTKEFNQTKGIAFKVKGNGTDSWLTVRVLPVSFSFRYYASVPVRGKEWQEVTLAWEDFINLSDRIDLPLGKSGALPLSGIMGVSFGDRWQIGYANEPLKSSDYEIKDLRLVDKAAASYVPLKQTPPSFDSVVQKMKTGKKVLIYCHGDSITAGSGVKELRYANLLRKSLRDFFKNPNIEIKTIAVGGAQSGDLRIWARRDFSGETKLDLVILSIGANDVNNGKTPEWFQASVNDWIDRVITYTKGQTAFLLIPTLPGQAWHQFMMDDFAEAIQSLAKKRGLEICDVAKRFRQIPDSELKKYFFSNDSLHPNSKGHELICDELMKYFREKAK